MQTRDKALETKSVSSSQENKQIKNKGYKMRDLINTLEKKLFNDEITPEKFWKFQGILDKKYNVENEKNNYTLDGFFHRVHEGLLGTNEKFSILIDKESQTWYYDEYQVDVEITWVKIPYKNLPEDIENHYRCIFQIDDEADRKLVRDQYKIYFNGKSFHITQYENGEDNIAAPYSAVKLLEEWVRKNYNVFLASSFSSKERPLEMMKFN